MKLSLCKDIWIWQDLILSLKRNKWHWGYQLSSPQTYVLFHLNTEMKMLRQGSLNMLEDLLREQNKQASVLICKKTRCKFKNSSEFLLKRSRFSHHIRSSIMISISSQNRYKQKRCQFCHIMSLSDAFPQMTTKQYWCW